MQVAESKQVVKQITVGPHCTVCDHSEIDAIDKLLASGSSSRRTIANQFGLNDGAVQRHKTNHLPKRIAKAAAKRDERADSRLLADIEYLWKESTQYVEDAKLAVKMQQVTTPDGNEYREFRDIGAMGPALAAAHKNRELFGNATGVFVKDSPDGRQPFVVILAQQLTTAPASEEPDQAIETIDVKAITS